MCVATVLKQLIDSKGTSYTFISEKTGIPVDSLSKTFLKKRKLSADEMITICQALDVDLSTIMSLKSSNEKWA